MIFEFKFRGNNINNKVVNKGTYTKQWYVPKILVLYPQICLCNIIRNKSGNIL